MPRLPALRQPRFQGIDEFSPIVFFLESRKEKIFITLVDILGAPAGALVDCVD